MNDLGEVILLVEDGGLEDEPLVGEEPLRQRGRLHLGQNFQPRTEVAAEISLLHRKI